MSCQKCYIVMSLTQKQRTVLINGIAKSKTMEQVKLDISTVKEVCNMLSLVSMQTYGITLRLTYTCIVN